MQNVNYTEINENNPLTFLIKLSNSIYRYNGKNDIYKYKCVSILFTILFFIFMLIIYLLNSFYKNSNNLYIAYKKEEFKNSFHSFLIPMFFFFVLDNFLKEKHWDWLGKTAPQSLIKMSTTEPCRCNNFIKYIRNSYSSSSQISAGVYIINFNYLNNQNYVSTLLGFSMIFLGITSYIWWSNTKMIIRHYNHLFMELHMFSLILNYFGQIIPTYEIVLLCLSINFFVIRNFTIVNANLFILFLLERISCIILIIYFEDIGNILFLIFGTISIFIGMIFKVADVYDNYIFGTAFFHLFSALGILFQFKWSQTILEHI